MEDDDSVHFLRSPSSLSDLDDEKLRQGANSTWSTSWSQWSAHPPRIQPGQQMDAWSDTTSAVSLGLGGTPDVMQAVAELRKADEADPQEGARGVASTQSMIGEASQATLATVETSRSHQPLVQLAAAIVDNAVEAAKAAFPSTHYSSVQEAREEGNDHLLLDAAEQENMATLKVDDPSSVDVPSLLEGEPLLQDQELSRSSSVQDEAPPPNVTLRRRSVALTHARERMRTRAEEDFTGVTREISSGQDAKEDEAIEELQRAMRIAVARMELLKASDEWMRTAFGGDRHQGRLATSALPSGDTAQIRFFTEDVQTYQAEQDQLVFTLAHEQAASPTSLSRTRGGTSTSPKVRKRSVATLREDSSESSSSRRVAYSNFKSMKEQRHMRQLEVASPSGSGATQLQRPKRPEDGARRAPLTGRDKNQARGLEGKRLQKQKNEAPRKVVKSRLEESAVLELQSHFRMLQARQTLAQLHQHEAHRKLQVMQRCRQAQTEAVTEDATLHHLTNEIVKGALHDAHHDLVLELRMHAPLVHRQTPSIDGDSTGRAQETRKALRKAPPAGVSIISGASEDSRSPPGSPRQSTRLCGRPNLRFFLTTTEERIAGGVLAGEYDVQPPLMPRSPRASPGYRLTYHASKQEARVAAEVYATGPKSPQESPRQEHTSTSPVVQSPPSSRNSQRGGNVPLLPQSRQLASLAPLFSPRGQPGGAMDMEDKQANGSVSQDVELADGEASGDEVSGAPVVPSSPSKPSSPRTSARRVISPRQDPHGWKLPLSQPRPKIAFPVLDGRSEFAKLKAFEEDFGRAVDHGDLIFALKSWVMAQANPQPSTETTRRPGSWSKQWVEQNTVPFRWSGSFAFVAHASEEAGKEMKAESSIISLPAVMGSEASISGSLGHVTSPSKEVPMGATDSTHIAESPPGGTSRQQLTAHPSSPPSARARKLLPAKLTMHRCGPLPAVRVLENRRQLAVDMGGHSPDLDS